MGGFGESIRAALAVKGECQAVHMVGRREPRKASPVLHMAWKSAAHMVCVPPTKIALFKKKTTQKLLANLGVINKLAQQKKACSI